MKLLTSLLLGCCIFQANAQNPLYSKLESQMDYALREASIYAIPKGEKIFPRT
ncbi:MAG: hypothetical protein RI903_337, partial [Bacteroidota bacterium]